MRPVILVKALPHLLASVEGRLSSVNEVKALVRNDAGEHNLALLLDVEDPRALASFLDNRLRLLTGVQDCRTIMEPSTQIMARFQAIA